MMSNVDIYLVIPEIQTYLTMMIIAVFIPFSRPIFSYIPSLRFFASLDLLDKED